MQHSFLQRVFMTVMAGMVCAFFYVYIFRNVVESAIYETSNEGYRAMFNDPPPKKR